LVKTVLISGKANGIDNNPVEPYTERKSISTEHTFGQDTIDIPRLKSILVGMVEKLAFQLRSEEWLTSTVVIKIRYSNFDTETKQCRIPYTSADHTLTSDGIIRQAIPTSHAVASDWYSI
jgi:DNA polymerase-4